MTPHTDDNGGEPLLLLPTFEVRSFAGECRMATAGDGRRVCEGYAAVFDARSQVLRSDDDTPFVEYVRRGAFTRALGDANCDPRALINHDKRFLLGRRGAGTLRIAEDSRGLHYEVTPGTRSYERDLEESLERGDIYGSSFGFAAVDDDWADGEDGLAVRSLKAVHLFDVGPVVYPAYRAATATLRSLKTFVEQRSARQAPPAAARAAAPAELVDLFNRLTLQSLG